MVCTSTHRYLLSTCLRVWPGSLFRVQPEPETRTVNIMIAGVVQVHWQVHDFNLNIGITRYWNPSQDLKFDSETSTVLHRTRILRRRFHWHWLGCSTVAPWQVSLVVLAVCILGCCTWLFASCWHILALSHGTVQLQVCHASVLTSEYYRDESWSRCKIVCTAIVS